MSVVEEKSMYDKAKEAADFILSQTSLRPKIALILGSGLGDFGDALEDVHKISYETIPGFKKSTVAGHAGKLCIGMKSDKPVVCMQGRYHFYEGHTINEVTFPCRVFKLMGITHIIITNAAGGISRLLEPGDLMILRDHINLMGTNPLIGPNDNRFGPRFCDMSHVFPIELQNIIAAEMKELHLAVKRGVYIAVTGPSYETPAEIQAFQRMGADAVGMSTVPEAIVCNHMGIQCLGISCVTNPAAGVALAPLNHAEVIETADRVKPLFIQLLTGIIRRLDVQ